MTPEPLRPPDPPLRSVPPYPKRGGTGVFESFIHAWNGLVHTVVHQRNMRMHMVAGILVGMVGTGIPLGLAEKVTLIFCVLFVFFAEILNSALEQLVDLAIQQFDEKARLTKDAAAAGVLVLAAGTSVIFAAICVHNWAVISTHVPQIWRQVALGVPLASCGALLMSPVRRPVVADVLAFLAGCGLMVKIALHSESDVFSAMTFGLLVLGAAAAIEGRRERSGLRPR